MRLADQAADLLAPSGAISRAMPGFAARAPQVAMARAVADTLQDGGVLLIEAPTGAGKSLGYLAALAASLAPRRERRAVVSTATITLQEQLAGKDLPVIDRAAGGIESALLKGMGRYLCLLKWRGLDAQMALHPRAEREAFARWVDGTATGDQNELASVPSWWGEVAADHSDCLGPACSMHLQCFALAAREAARRAQLVVTNHHLLLLARRYGTATGSLPSEAPVVLDEAHRLPEIATEVYGSSVTDHTFVALAQRLHGAVQAARDPLHEQIAQALVAHRRLMDRLRPRGAEPAPLPEVGAPARAQYLAAIQQLAAALAGRAWEVVRDRSGTSASERAAILIRMLEGYHRTIAAILEPLAGTASWVEPVDGRQATLTLRNAPVEISGALGTLFGAGAPPAILCSATLAAGGSFAHLKRRLGIGPARELVLPPIFDYAQQMRYYLPREPLDPRAATFTDQVARSLIGLLQASQGRALVLFTSYEQLRAVAERLRGTLPYTLLVQDQASTTGVLQRFRDDIHSVLLATARYWEGVDVPGEALSLLVVVRLPFDVPTHPLARARYEAAVSRGEDAFRTVVLPEAIIRLRQGAGRLIRSTADRGVVAILDGRVETKGYGRRFMAALPRAPRLSTHEEVAAFLARQPAAAEVRVSVHRESPVSEHRDHLFRSIVITRFGIVIACFGGS